jgi:hypothetical protein
VIEGFEGPSDGAKQRGKMAGWKIRALPWTQS